MDRALLLLNYFHLRLFDNASVKSSTGNLEIYIKMHVLGYTLAGHNLRFSNPHLSPLPLEERVKRANKARIYGLYNLFETLDRTNTPSTVFFTQTFWFPYMLCLKDQPGHIINCLSCRFLYSPVSVRHICSIHRLQLPHHPAVPCQ